MLFFWRGHVNIFLVGEVGDEQFLACPLPTRKINTIINHQPTDLNQKLVAHV